MVCSQTHLGQHSAEWLLGHDEENLLAVQKWLKLTSKFRFTIYSNNLDDNTPSLRKELATHI